MNCRLADAIYVDLIINPKKKMNCRLADAVPSEAGV